MAKQRQVSDKFWYDPFVAELETDEKLIFIYLITNQHIEITGIYEISIRQISFDTAITTERVKAIIKKLSEAGKVYYENGYIILANYHKYTSYNMQGVREYVINQLEALPKALREKHKTTIESIKGLALASTTPVSNANKAQGKANQRAGQPLDKASKINENHENQPKNDDLQAQGKANESPRQGQPPISISISTPNPISNSISISDPNPIPMDTNSTPKYIRDLSGKVVPNPEYQDQVRSGQEIFPPSGPGQVRSGYKDIDPNQYCDYLKMSKAQWTELYKEFGDSAFDLISIVDEWIETQNGFKVKSPVKLCQKFGRDILNEKGVIKWQP